MTKSSKKQSDAFEEKIEESVSREPPPSDNPAHSQKEGRFWEKQRIANDGLEQFYKLRKCWSVWVILWISILIAFNIILTFLTGWSVLNFQSYQWFITSVTVETFLQIAGMGYIAVKFLFSSGERK